MHTSIQNAYEKEIETLLHSSNGIITKQKDAIEKAQEGDAWKAKIRELEKQHTQEKQQSQTQFDQYKASIERKEQDMDRQHKEKVQSMKTEVMDIKAGFDQRVLEFKKQIDDFRKNNEAIDALKKAHAKELAAHVQEHNRKYNELLTEKLNSEDALKTQAE